MLGAPRHEDIGFYFHCLMCSEGRDHIKMVAGNICEDYMSHTAGKFMGFLESWAVQI